MYANPSGSAIRFYLWMRRRGRDGLTGVALRVEPQQACSITNCPEPALERRVALYPCRGGTELCLFCSVGRFRTCRNIRDLHTQERVIHHPRNIVTPPQNTQSCDASCF